MMLLRRENLKFGCIFLANEASFEKQETAEKFDKPKEKSVILSEMKMYENNPSTRPPTLEKLYKALMTIPPTSVESERTFSTASFYGNIEIKCIDFLEKLFKTSILAINLFT